MTPARLKQAGRLEVEPNGLKDHVFLRDLVEHVLEYPIHVNLAVQYVETEMDATPRL